MLVAVRCGVFVVVRCGVLLGRVSSVGHKRFNDFGGKQHEVGMKSFLCFTRNGPLVERNFL